MDVSEARYIYIVCNNITVLLRHLSLPSNSKYIIVNLDQNYDYNMYLKYVNSISLEKLEDAKRSEVIKYYRLVFDDENVNEDDVKYCVLTLNKEEVDSSSDGDENSGSDIDIYGCGDMEEDENI